MSGQLQPPHTLGAIPEAFLGEPEYPQASEALWPSIGLEWGEGERLECLHMGEKHPHS